MIQIQHNLPISNDQWGLKYPKLMIYSEFQNLFVFIIIAAGVFKSNMLLSVVMMFNGSKNFSRLLFTSGSDKGPGTFKYAKLWFKVLKLQLSCLVFVLGTNASRWKAASEKHKIFSAPLKACWKVQRFTILLKAHNSWCVQRLLAKWLRQQIR